MMMMMSDDDHDHDEDEDFDDYDDDDDVDDDDGDGGGAGGGDAGDKKKKSKRKKRKMTTSMVDKWTSRAGNFVSFPASWPYVYTTANKRPCPAAVNTRKIVLFFFKLREIISDNY